MAKYQYLVKVFRRSSALRERSNWIVRLIALTGLLLAAFGIVPAPVDAAEITFSAEELLARPTDDSITINVVPDEGIELYYEYDTDQGEPYAHATSPETAVAGEPHNVVISGLDPNTRYYYRMQYRTPGDDWVARPEHSFWTQRAPGSSFKFTIIADSHMSGGGGNVSLYEQALANVVADGSDFHFDLGDSFWTDGVTTSTAANQRYMAQRDWMGVISHSTPTFVAPGNHENEEGWNLDDSNSIALLSINARKRYYPNPVPDSFYLGNPDTTETGIDGDHLREDYFAWEWGDALFVVIDPYQYTLVKPFAGTAGGEANDESPIGDRWDWTLGDDQFIWFKATLENSDAAYKFVFSHHILGGSQDYVREGAEVAHMFEWGGYNIDGTTWGFDVERPGWGDDPVHQLMVANHVSAYFYGHDHEYAYQKRDGVVYQLVPSPSMSGYGFNLYSESDPYTLRVLPNAGHLRVTLEYEPTARAKIEYVRSGGAGVTPGEVSHTYYIEPNPTAITLAELTATSGRGPDRMIIVAGAIVLTSAALLFFLTRKSLSCKDKSA